MNRKRESTRTGRLALASDTTISPRLSPYRLILGVFGVLLAVYLPARVGRRFMTLSSLLMLESSTVAPNEAATSGAAVESKTTIPEVAWLMTYPNSGTTYTLKLIQQYTNTTTATNYGNEQSRHEKSIPVHPGTKGEHGPYLRYTDRNLPTHYILTKTHCGGRSLSSDPREYFETIESFEMACCTGNQQGGDSFSKNGTYQKSEVVYSMDIPKRIVHLIRNPFDVRNALIYDAFQLDLILLILLTILRFFYRILSQDYI